MRYFSVSCGNGYAGCDEKWLMEGEEFPECTDIYDVYTYNIGAAGLSIGGDGEEDDEEYYDITEDEYYGNIMENIFIDEISEEEFMHLRDSECWEVR